MPCFAFAVMAGITVVNKLSPMKCWTRTTDHLGSNLSPSVSTPLLHIFHMLLVAEGSLLRLFFVLLTADRLRLFFALVYKEMLGSFLDAPWFFQLPSYTGAARSAISRPLQGRCRTPALPLVLLRWLQEL